jgi:hypothetical protein
MERRDKYATTGKRFWLIKDAKLLDSGAYSDFIVVRISLRKRM